MTKALAASQDVVEQIRVRMDIIDVVSEHVHLKKSGSNFKGLCPFHQERTPSFMVNPSKQMFYCFGCSAGGDVFSFVMKMEGVTFLDALHALARRAGVEIVPQEKPTQAWRDKEELYKIHEFAARLYRDTFRTSPAAESIREYVARRGLREASLDLFGIGYAPSSRDFFLEAGLKEGFSQTALIKSGLVVQREDGGLYDRFRHRLLFPIHDGQGRIMAFGGRMMDEGQPKYLNSPETPIYQKGLHLYGWPFSRSSVAKEGRIILVEGYVDCLALHQAGVTNSVATLGTALTSSHAAMIKRYTDTCFLAFDVDAAGIQASGRGAEALIEQGLLVKVVELPAGKDPDEVVLKEGGAAAWGELMASAPNFFETLVPTDIKSLDHKLEIVKKVIPLLAKVQNEIEKAEYVKWFSSKIKTEERFVWKELKNVKPQASAQGRPSTQIKKETSRAAEPLEEKQLLKLLTEDNEFARQVKERFGISGFLHPVHQKIAQGCFDLLDRGTPPSLDALRGVGCVSEEEMQAFSQLSFVDLPPMSSEKMTLDFLRNMETRSLKKQLEELKVKIEEGRRQGLPVAEWSMAFNQVMRQLKGSK